MLSGVGIRTAQALRAAAGKMRDGLQRAAISFAGASAGYGPGPLFLEFFPILDIII